MKRPRPDYSEQQWRIERKRNKRKFRFRVRERKSSLNRKDWLEIQAPEILSVIEDNYRYLTLKFLGNLRLQYGLHHRNININFTCTREMVVDGALLLLAELSRLKREYPRAAQIRCTPPRNSKTCQALTQIGVFDLLNHKSQVTPSDEDVVHWRVSTGEGAVGERYEDIVGEYDREISEQLRQSLYVGLTEAMTNCQNHAYIGIRKDGLNRQDSEKQWWMFSQHRDQRLRVAFCDLGVGIHATLPEKNPGLWEKILTMVGKYPRDSKVIYEAIKHSQSRTGKSYRGKGLTQLVNVVKNTAEADLRLVSNKGYYRVNSGGTSYTDNKESILGTLVCWSIPLESRG